MPGKKTNASSGELSLYNDTRRNVKVKIDTEFGGKKAEKIVKYAEKFAYEFISKKDKDAGWVIEVDKKRVFIGRYTPKGSPTFKVIVGKYDFQVSGSNEFVKFTDPCLKFAFKVLKMI